MNPIDEPSDLDQNNPTDILAITWEQLYAEMTDPEGFIEHDHSMDY